MLLKHWDTPFSSAQFPSAILIADSDGDRTATIVVAPIGLDAYPKYLVRFRAVLAFSVEEEAGPQTYAGAVFPGEPASCTFVSADSDHVSAYTGFLDFFGYPGPMLHYVVFGGDNNVAVVAGEPPQIEVVNAQRKLTVEYEV